MTPTDQGRFCAACSKCVIDLTAKKPAEIKEIYQANDGDICGRMSVSQFVSPPAQRTDDLPPTSGVLKKLQLFAVALLATFSFGLHSVQAQNRPIKGKIAHVPTDVRIEGQVRWNHGSAGAGVIVQVWEGSELVQASTADEKGNFAFKNLERGQYRVVAKAGSWVSTERQTNTRQGGKFVMILQLEDVQVDGGLGYVEPAVIEETFVEETTEETTSEPIRDLRMGQMIYIEEADVPAPLPVTEEAPDAVEVIPVGKISYTELFDECSRVSNVRPVLEAEPPLVQDEMPLIDPESAESAEAEIDNEQSREEKLILDDLQFTIFPNPTDGELRIRLDSPSKRSVRYLLYDMNGRSLAAHRWEPGMSAEYLMNLNSYASGTYLLRVLSGETMVEKRIVKR